MRRAVCDEPDARRSGRVLDKLIATLGKAGVRERIMRQICCLGFLMLLALLILFRRRRLSVAKRMPAPCGPVRNAETPKRANRMRDTSDDWSRDVIERSISMGLFKSLLGGKKDAPSRRAAASSRAM